MTPHPPIHHHAARVIAGAALLALAAIVSLTIEPPRPAVQWWRRGPS